MKRRVFLGTALVLGLALAWLLVAGLGAAPAGHTASAATSTLDRPGDPVVVNGAAFPDFAGAPLEELALYVYRDGAWAPVPFQIDEVSITGTHVFSEDGLLDGNDELVFMAADAGDSVPPFIWPDDAAAQMHTRYVITATDPLTAGAQGWAYLYRSATLPRSDARYVSWDGETETMAAISYTAGFTSEQFLGLASLSLHDSDVDVLDRQKIRGQVTAFAGPVPIFTQSFNEENVLDFFSGTVTGTATLPISGPVRIGGGSGTQGGAFYGARADFAFSVDLSDVMTTFMGIPVRIHVDTIRTSLDLNDPAGTGMAPTTYYDSNGTMAGVDGTPDAVPATPPWGWYQIDGALGGWVTVGQVDPAAGTLANYYKDDAAVDPDDTGDGQSFGDSGLRIDDPDGVITVTQTLYVLPAGAGNSGATYQQYANNPLVADTAGQTYQPGFTVYLPTVLKD